MLYDGKPYEGKPLILGLNSFVGEDSRDLIFDLTEDSLVDVKIASVIEGSTVKSLNTYRGFPKTGPPWIKLPNGDVRYRVGDLVKYMEERILKQRARVRRLIALAVALARAKAEA